MFIQNRFSAPNIQEKLRAKETGKALAEIYPLAFPSVPRLSSVEDDCDGGLPVTGFTANLLDRVECILGKASERDR